MHSHGQARDWTLSVSWATGLVHLRYMSFWLSGSKIAEGIGKGQGTCDPGLHKPAPLTHKVELGSGNRPGSKTGATKSLAARDPRETNVPQMGFGLVLWFCQV